MSTREIVNVSKRMAAGDSRRDGTALARKKEAQLLDRQSAMADYEAARARYEQIILDAQRHWGDRPVPSRN